MRFCHVTTFYPPYHFGGDAILVRAMCKALARRGHRVDVVHCIDAFQLKGGAVVEAAREGSGVRTFPLRSALGAISPIWTQQTGRPGPKRRRLEEILDYDYDVVNFHNISLVGGPAVLRMSRAPVTLYTLHEHWLFCPTHVLWKYRSRPCDRPQCLSCSLISGVPPQLWRYSSLVRRSLERVDALLAPTEFTARRHREAGISRPIRVIRPFTRIESMNAASDRPNPADFAYVGRLVRSKGIEQLIEAIRRRPRYRLSIAGDGPLGAKLRRSCRGLTNVRFLGEVPHDRIRDVYRQASALVLPSIGPEVFGMSALESMSVGVPVVVRRAGGSAESVEQTGGGVVYDDEDELLPLLDDLAGDPSQRQSLSERARRGVARLFSEERWLDQYIALIESIRQSDRNRHGSRSR